MVRTITFVILVVRYPDNAIDAFSIAQVVSSIVYLITHYGYFFWFTRNFKAEESKDMKDFPFVSLLDFLPGFMRNKVIKYCLLLFLSTVNSENKPKKVVFLQYLKSGKYLTLK